LSPPYVHPRLLFPKTLVSVCFPLCFPVVRHFSGKLSPFLQDIEPIFGTPNGPPPVPWTRFVGSGFTIPTPNLQNLLCLLGVLFEPGDFYTPSSTFSPYHPFSFFTPDLMLFWFSGGFFPRHTVCRTFPFFPNPVPRSTPPSPT